MLFREIPIIMKKMFRSLRKNLKKGKPKNISTISTDLFESVIGIKTFNNSKKAQLTVPNWKLPIF